MSFDDIRCRRPAGGIIVCATTIILAACSGEGTAVPAVPNDVEAPSAAAEFDPEHRERVAALAAAWPAEPSYTVSFNALDPSADIVEEVRASPFDPNDPHWGLPEDEGRDQVEAYCGACHSLRLVMQQSMVETGWDATLTRMVSDRGMPPMPPDVRQSILSYLTVHFGAEG